MRVVGGSFCSSAVNLLSQIKVIAPVGGLFLTLLNTPILYAGDNTMRNRVSVFSSAETLSYSENLSIDAWLNDMQAPNPSQGEYAMTRNSSELGMSWRGFSVSGFGRRDYYFHFSNDTFDIVYRDKNNLSIDQNRDYNILLDVAHVDLQGGKFAYEFSPLTHLNTKVTLGIFSAEQLLFGRIEGFLGGQNKKIRGDLLLDYNYTEDVVLDRELTPPGEGKGKSLDVEAWWQARENLKVHVLLQDLYGVIKWRKAPFTQATITTVRTYTDGAGNEHRMPTISGKEFFRDINQRIPRHSTFGVDYRLNDHVSIESQYDRYGDLGFSRLGAGYHVNDSLALGLAYDFSAKAPRLTLRSTYLNFVISADSTDPKQAKYINGSVELNIAF